MKLLSYYLPLTVLALLVGFSACSQNQEKLAVFTAKSGQHKRTNTPVGASLQGLPIQLESFSLKLYEIDGAERKPVKAQLHLGQEPQLYWVLEGETPAHASRMYELVKEEKSDDADAAVTLVDNGEAIEAKRGNQPVFNYKYTVTNAPEGVSDRYARGGYFHPLYSPKGSELTRIQPSDHYHHYGLWNPWTHTEYKGREIDFWNLIKAQGTIEVNEVPVYSSGDVFGEMEVRQDHIVFEDTTRAKKETALRETLNVKVWNAGINTETTIMDHTSTYVCGTQNPLTLTKYRYQGFGFRARANWYDDNVFLLTSEGKNKKDGNSTRARWCIISGPTEQGTSGVLFMTYPTNYNYPELIRIWPEGANKGIENVFFNFNPTMDRDFVMDPGKQYALKYRIVLFEGEMNATQAEQYWNDFVNPPKVDVTYLEKTTPDANSKKRILLYTKNGEGYVHKNIPNSIAAIKKLGEAYNFEVDASEDPTVFTDENLKNYDALVFSNTNNEAFDNQSQRDALQNYIRSGGAFVGIHSASGSERDWPWFWQMLGGKFKRHPKYQEFDIKVMDNTHPSTAMLPATYTREDECYLLTNLSPGIHTLLAADLTSIEDDKLDEYPGEIFGDYFPIAWYQYFDGGKQWYTALGHSPEHYEDPVFIQHIAGGILWAIGAENTVYTTQKQ